MAAIASFRAALDRLGFSQAATEAMIANGFNTTEDTLNLTDKDIEQVLKIIRTGPPVVVVPFLAQKRLKTFSFWATRRRRLGESITAHHFTNPVLEQYTNMMNIVDKDDDTAVKAPGEYEKDTKWKAFKEGMIAYLNALKGRHNILLTYVIREHVVPPANAVYQSEHHQ
jgi:hypothetical protein